ncbi:hypothetical protein [Noviherbaspirillum cavernae]|nr:hypothetical protein [Noviherbaspirillum cavernae]
MHSTFHASDSGQAIVQNATTVGVEQLVVTLHPGNDSCVEVQIKEEVSGDIVASAISINQSGLQQLVRWLREQGAVD